MQKNIPRIYRRAAFMILAVIISGLLNICLFALQARAAAPLQAPPINFAYDDNYAYGNDYTDCLAEALPRPKENLNRPTAPMPQCCLTRNRNFNAVINTANDKTAPTFTGLIFSASDAPNTENNFTYNTSQNIYPPPALLALTTTVIRE